MKRNHTIAICASAVMLLAATPTVAQETYENARLATEDLNGTARYVGMGGAMDALGADISTIGTNPAGIGLFRHSQARLSFGFVSQQDAQSFVGASKTKMSFDQVGFVYAHRTSRSTFVNFAFNYHKSTDFNHILSAAGNLAGASQNKLSYMKWNYGIFNSSEDATYNQIDYLYYPPLENNENPFDLGYFNATGYSFNRVNEGYIGEYDFNISGNINDRIYLGLTLGIHDVNYSNYSEYRESLIDAYYQQAGTVVVSDDRSITGTGFNIKLGMIVRPIEDSPFRIGLSMATPTWYDLTTRNYTTLSSPAGEETPFGTGSIQEVYDFKLYTPWKFGVSLGTTVGNYLAIGASYDYADYGKIDSRVNEGGYYDEYWGTYYDESSSDRAMNDHTDRTLKGVSTVKVGMEYKPDAALAIRLGYNYVSPMYNKYGFKDGSINSYGTYYASTTDYTNWKATNRITCGIGYTFGKFTADVAYQYSVTNGDFKPMTDFVGGADYPEDDISVASTEVSNKRHQMIFTLGYAF